MTMLLKKYRLITVPNKGFLKGKIYISFKRYYKITHKCRYCKLTRGCMVNCHGEIGLFRVLGNYVYIPDKQEIFIPPT